MDTIVFTDHTFEDLSIEREVLDGVAELVDAEERDEPLAALLPEADGIIAMYETVDGDLLDLMPDCRVVSRTGIGIDNIDVDAATERGIPVANVPDYCITEVSDHTIALLLALERKVVTYDGLVAAGEWDVAAGRPMRRLDGRTLGLVGFGNIGRAVCEKAGAFGLEVIAYDPYVDAAGTDATLVDLPTLLDRADAVSVHTPLTPETRGLIGRDELARMGESAVLVNTARGGIVDEDALVEALDAGEIAAAALDVLATEPPNEDDPLLGHDRVIVTPHAAYRSAESLVELRTKAAENVRAVLEGSEPSYPVNDPR